MNELIDLSVVTDDTVVQKDGKQNKGIWRILLAAVILVLLTMFFLLVFGISPLGRYLQSIDWIRETAKIFCS